MVMLVELGSGEYCDRVIHGVGEEPPQDGDMVVTSHTPTSTLAIVKNIRTHLINANRHILRSINLENAGLPTYTLLIYLELVTSL